MSEECKGGKRPKEGESPAASAEAARKARAAARASWPVKVYKLGEEPSDDLSDFTTAEERIAMVWPLTVEAWNVAGLEIHDLPREQWPVKVLHPEWMKRKDEDS